VVRAIPIPRQRFLNTFPQKQTRGTIGNLLLGNGAINRLCQQYRLRFPCGPCKVDIRESSSEAGSCGRTRIRIEGVKRSIMKNENESGACPSDL
jgi:hypothetical protein